MHSCFARALLNAFMVLSATVCSHLANPQGCRMERVARFRTWMEALVVLVVTMVTGSQCGRAQKRALEYEWAGYMRKCKHSTRISWRNRCHCTTQRPD